MRRPALAADVEVAEIALAELPLIDPAGPERALRAAQSLKT